MEIPDVDEQMPSRTLFKVGFETDAIPLYLAEMFSVGWHVDETLTAAEDDFAETG